MQVFEITKKIPYPINDTMNQYFKLAVIKILEIARFIVIIQICW